MAAAKHPVTAHIPGGDPATAMFRCADCSFFSRNNPNRHEPNPVHGRCEKAREMRGTLTVPPILMGTTACKYFQMRREPIREAALSPAS